MGEQPRKEAGRRLIEMLSDYSFGAKTNRWQAHLQKYVDQVVAIEREAATPDAPAPRRHYHGDTLYDAAIECWDDHAAAPDVPAPQTCPRCAHRPHESGECKARYRVTFQPGEMGDPCLCEDTETEPGS